MSKKDIVDNVYAKMHETDGLSKTTVKELVDNVFEEVINLVNSAGQCRIVGFGSFKKYRRAAREASHPQTREKIHVPACNSVKFAIGSEFKSSVQED